MAARIASLFKQRRVVIDRGRNRRLYFPFDVCTALGRSVFKALPSRIGSLSEHAGTRAVEAVPAAEAESRKSPVACLARRVGRPACSTVQCIRACLEY